MSWDVGIATLCVFPILLALSIHFIRSRYSGVRLGLTESEIWGVALRLPSTLHALFVVVLSLINIIHRVTVSLEPDHILLGMTSLSKTCSSASIAYFSLDLFILTYIEFLKSGSTTENSKFGFAYWTFMTHHIVGIVCQAIALYYSVAAIFVSVLLITEITTPLINAMYFGIKTDPYKEFTSSFVFKILAVLLVFTWLVFRLFFGIGCLVYGLFHLDLIKETYPSSMIYIGGFTLVFLGIANVFWFFQILGKSRGGPSTTATA